MQKKGGEKKVPKTTKGLGGGKKDILSYFFRGQSEGKVGGSGHLPMDQERGLRKKDRHVTNL